VIEPLVNATEDLKVEIYGSKETKSKKSVEKTKKPLETKGEKS
jgi:hypothetical protein